MQKMITKTASKKERDLKGFGLILMTAFVIALTLVLTAVVRSVH